MLADSENKCQVSKILSWSCFVNRDDILDKKLANAFHGCGGGLCASLCGRSLLRAISSLLGTTLPHCAGHARSALHGGGTRRLGAARTAFVCGMKWQFMVAIGPSSSPSERRSWLDSGILGAGMERIKADGRFLVVRLL